ncbi:hypothetical protein [Methylobacter marinus]|uniref:hypothetical protein n=1 Tax=Methylobacter marinus TaxID=34058 RepID=UPI000364589B|nr:hypothetical protein [Methylobacter marinus]
MAIGPNTKLKPSRVGSTFMLTDFDSNGRQTMRLFAHPAYLYVSLFAHRRDRILFSQINPTIIIAFVTFLWYRKGRLWNFYDSLSFKAVEQMKKNSIDRKAWEAIAIDFSNKLSGELINSTFRFEILYLREKIKNNKHDFWISDSSTIDGKTKRYTDKEKYCHYVMKELFYSDFRLCGVFLFINALKFSVCSRGKNDSGFSEIDLD